MKFIAAATCLVLLIAFGYFNNGRFGNIKSHEEDSKYIIESYVIKHAGEGYDCALNLETGHPKRMPKKVADLLSGLQEIWIYDWTCITSSDQISGFLVVYADGSKVWQGNSQTFGEFPTEEN